MTVIDMIQVELNTYSNGWEDGYYNAVGLSISFFLLFFIFIIF